MPTGPGPKKRVDNVHQIGDNIAKWKNNDPHQTDVLRANEYATENDELKMLEIRRKIYNVLIHNSPIQLKIRQD